MHVNFSQQVLDFAQKHQEPKSRFRHDQDFFYAENECGTAACLAGIACMLSSDVEIRNVTVDDEDSGYEGFEPFVNGKQAEWDDEAQRLMGLTPGQANDLFYTFDNEEAIALLQEYIEDAEQQAAP